MASEEIDRLIATSSVWAWPTRPTTSMSICGQAAQLKLGTSLSWPACRGRGARPHRDRAADLRLTQAEFPEILRLEDYDFKLQPTLNRKPGARPRRARLRRPLPSRPLDRPLRRGQDPSGHRAGRARLPGRLRVRFVRAYDLLTRLYAALADDTLDLVLEELCKPDLLIVDELGNSPRKREHDFAGVFFELVSRRYRRGAVVLTTNLGFEQWPSALGRLRR